VSHALGIDVGTTNVKVALVAPDGRAFATASRPLPMQRAGEVAEQDAEVLWSAVTDAVTETTRSAPDSARQVSAIGVCSQYSSTVPVDASGTPVGPLVMYLDQRGTDRCWAIAEDHPDAFEIWADRHGIPPVGSGLSMAHILHVQEQEPDRHERTVAYLEVMDYVTTRLTGRITATQASMFTSQVCDNRTLGATAYDDELIAMAGIDASRLPPLVPADEVVGTVLPDLADSLGVPDGVTVRAGMNDSSAGAFATGAFADGRAGLMVGTTAVLLDDVDHHGSDLDHQVLTMPSPVEDRWLVWAENGLAGKAVEHVLEQVVYANDPLGDHATDDGFAAFDATLAAVEPGSGGVLFLPWLSGSISPVASGGVRGGFLGLSLDTGRAALVRAAVEGTAHNLRWLLPVVEGFSGKRMDELTFGGGAARSGTWAQIIADVLDRPVVALADPETAVARATALVALEGPAALVDHVPATAARHEPDDTSRARYDAMHEQFLAAFEATRPITEALSG
jgi:xylulokinase